MCNFCVLSMRRIKIKNKTLVSHHTRLLTTNFQKIMIMMRCQKYEEGQGFFVLEGIVLSFQVRFLDV